MVHITQLFMDPNVPFAPKFGFVTDILTLKIFFFNYHQLDSRATHIQDRIDTSELPHAIPTPIVPVTDAAASCHPPLSYLTPKHTTKMDIFWDI